jgi:6-phosphogluconolactonase
LNSKIRIFQTSYELADKFAAELATLINLSATRNKTFTIALSGGNTPELLLSVLGDHYSNSVHWEYVHIFWGDERCVPPDNQESNYGMTLRKLFKKINIPEVNIHRIKGECDPEEEAYRYSGEISDYTRERDHLPLFDLILLGLGEDGHTASIFPGQSGLFKSDKICEVAEHPITRQKRITITARVINNADYVTFIVTGEKKAEVVKIITEGNVLAHNFPASYIVPVYGQLSWLIDKEAGRLL